MKEKYAGWVGNSVLCFKFEIIKFLSCLFTKLQDDPFKNKALLFSNNAQELHPDPFQAEDPFKSDPFKGADPFKGISLGAHCQMRGRGSAGTRVESAALSLGVGTSLSLRAACGLRPRATPESCVVAPAGGEREMRHKCQAWRGGGGEFWLAPHFPRLQPMSSANNTPFLFERRNSEKLPRPVASPTWICQSPFCRRAKHSSLL